MSETSSLALASCLRPTPRGASAEDVFGVFDDVRGKCTEENAAAPVLKPGDTLKQLSEAEKEAVLQEAGLGGAERGDRATEHAHELPTTLRAAMPFVILSPFHQFSYN